MDKAAPSVEIFVPIRDEESFLEFFCDFYRKRLTNLTINVVDRGSTDRTIDLCQSLGINVTLEPEEFFSDRANIDYKNNCWKKSNADFVIIQDLDELIDISDSMLSDERISAIHAEAWDMIGEGQQLQDISKANRLPFYDKIMVFRTSHFAEINYQPGAHICFPVYKVSKPVFLRAPMYHYNRVNLEKTLEKYARRKSILSPENLENGWGVQYLLTDDDIREEHQKLLSSAINILPTCKSLSPDYDPLEPVTTYFHKHFGALARIILDIGSRDGHDAQYLKSILNGQKIVTVEANPDLAKEILATYPDFQVWETAVGNFNGRTSFLKVISEDRELLGCSSIDSNYVRKYYAHDVIEVPVFTMEHLLVQNLMAGQILDVVKIDCEGFTMQVLEGFGKYLKNIRLLHLETERYATHQEHVNTQQITRFMFDNKFSLVESSSEWGNGQIDQIWVNKELALYQREFLL